MAQTRQRKQPRLWLIIINHNTPNQRKCDVHIDDSGMDHEQLLRILPNNATLQLKRLPPYMNDIAAAVTNKTIKCSFLMEALTDYLVNLTTRFPYEELSRLHDSPNLFLDQCIDYVVNCYIEIQWNCLKQFYHWKKTSQSNFCGRTFRILTLCKREALWRQQDEKYLGNKSFADEFCCSFDEFILIVESSFGFLPYD
jgi:hypothetical protein